MKKLLILFLLAFGAENLFAQINAKLMRDMDVSDSHIAFVYGGDIWLVDKNGGTANQLTRSQGVESYPKFSPDGQHIAYSAYYNGNEDIYVVPVTGGVPERVTYASFSDRMVEWHPDGEHLLFASRRLMGQRSANQLFLVSRDGGLPEPLPLPYGELASYSPDGNQLAYITKITENYPFKRYKGGLASDIYLYDIDSNTVENLTENEFNDGQPAWAGDTLYFLSDQGPNFRLNIWKYNPADGELTQITAYDEFDISFLSAGPEELVFEVGGSLFLMDLSTEEVREIEVNVVSDLSLEIPKRLDVSGDVSGMSAAPGNKRVIFEARGELFNAPVSEGFTENVTQSSGAYDRHAAWAPDGSSVAYWSDMDGEYEIYLQDVTNSGSPQKLTNRGKGYGYALYWSPNSESIAFIDETNTIFVVDVNSGNVTAAGSTNWNVGHGGRNSYPISWSPD